MPMYVEDSSCSFGFLVCWHMYMPTIASVGLVSQKKTQGVHESEGYLDPTDIASVHSGLLCSGS